jgi:hypothetical protein
MKLTPEHKAIINAEKCPYCKSTTKVVSQEFIYGKSYTGRSIICCSNFPKCDSFVGTHSDGATLGRLADKSLRAAKIEAHKYFDEIWHKGILSRKEAYKWLSEELDIPPEFTHIGMFSTKTCIRVVELCKLYLLEHHEKSKN